MKFEVIAGDCRTVMATMTENSVDSICTDPPYGLEFMGKDWDRGVPGVHFWQEAYRVLKPGGYLLAFGGSRTYHRLAVAIEDAGFEIRDMIEWVYASGFPKSHKIEAAPGFGSALKPAHEPICLARKPMIGTLAENHRVFGTGLLNIDGCRIPTDDALGGGAETGGNAAVAKHEGWRRPWMEDEQAVEAHASRVRANVKNAEALGRWPANFIHDGSDEVIGYFPESDGARAPVTGLEPSDKTSGILGEYASRSPSDRTGEAGSAARFFFCPKPSSAERDDGLWAWEEKEFIFFQTGNGASGRPSSISEGRDVRRRNPHPTVKPTALMAYLCRLITPPGGTVLDPFAGSGTTGRGAAMEGFDFIGIELSPEYADIARARIAAAVKTAARLAHEEALRKSQLSLF